MIDLHSMVQAERTETFRSFAELGAVFNIAQAPDRDYADFDYFTTLPVSKKLRDAHHAHINKQPNEKPMRQMATRAVLEMDPLERGRQRIHPIVYAPMDKQGQMITSDVFTYQIHTVFPHLGGFQYLSTSRLAMQYAFAINPTISQDTLAVIDVLVQNQAELRPETPYDRYNRLVQEIKMADSLIKEQKVCASQRTERGRAYDVSKESSLRQITGRMNELNDTKTARILEYLKLAQNLEAAFPRISPLYTVNGQDACDGNHRTLIMHNPLENNRQRRLIDQTIPAVLVLPEKKLVFTTNINIAIAMQGKTNCLAGSELPADQASFEMCEILGL